MRPLVKVSFRYGVLAGVIGSLLLIGLYYLERHPFLIPVFMDFRFILFGVFMFFTLRELRDYHYNGALYFWQGLVSCFLFTISYAGLASLIVMVFSYAVPQFVSDYISLKVAEMKLLGAEDIERIGREVYERNLASLPHTRAWDLAALYFVQCFLISLFLSIILSVTLRREAKT